MTIGELRTKLKDLMEESGYLNEDSKVVVQLRRNAEHNFEIDEIEEHHIGDYILLTLET